MKNLFTFLVILITINITGQTIDFSVPLKTRHFQSQNYIDQIYAEGEGGNIGLFVTYSPKSKKKLKDTYTIGAYRNSYGNFTAIATYGKNYFITKSTNISLNVGIATGYHRVYDSKNRFDNKTIISKEYEGGSFMKKNGILPVYTLSLQQVIYKNTYIMASINHQFVNFGVGYRFDFKK